MSAWEQRKLGEITSHRGGTAIEKYFDENGEYKVISIGSYGLNSKYVDQNIRAKSNEITNERVVHAGELTMVLNDKTANGTIIGRSLLIENDNEYVINQRTEIITPKENFNNKFAYTLLNGPFRNKVRRIVQGGTQIYVNYSSVEKLTVFLPNIKEQEKIAEFFHDFDSLIALHQRKPFIKNGGIKMITSNFTCDSLFKDYFEFWIKLYKEGAVRPVTLEKYRNNQKHIAKIIPNLKMKDFDRNAYQELLNQYALTHERQTVIDFHHQVKGAILDAVDDGLIDRDPTRKAIFKGKAPREKKQKYLNQFELHNLLEDLDLGMEITWDWLILLIAKTGLRFSEALGLTPADFDFARQTISVNKTWDYKTNTGFQPTKNRSSIRKVQMDWQLGMQFQHLIKNLNEDEPIFVNGPVCNSTPNNCLARHCRKCGIPEISIHGLRHTHASLLMFAGVSIASVSRRLGHSSITTTQKVYMHIISELENQDNDLVMRYLSSLS
ncbi:tyrosine-type recombinase/integrase [Ligilactobacillus salivarius]|nr:tyrosine-type recombinase/integrase [Ligilactobacillus salivarius]